MGECRNSQQGEDGRQRERCGFHAGVVLDVGGPLGAQQGAKLVGRAVVAGPEASDEPTDRRLALGAWAETNQYEVVELVRLSRARLWKELRHDRRAVTEVCGREAAPTERREDGPAHNAHA